jgi:hypothetical protein
MEKNDVSDSNRIEVRRKGMVALLSPSIFLMILTKEIFQTMIGVLGENETILVFSPEANPFLSLIKSQRKRVMVQGGVRIQEPNHGRRDKGRFRSTLVSSLFIIYSIALCLSIDYITYHYLSRPSLHIIVFLDPSPLSIALSY